MDNNEIKNETSNETNNLVNEASKEVKPSSTSGEYSTECLYKPNIPLVVSLTLLPIGLIIGALFLYVNSRPSFVFKKIINEAFLSVENALDISNTKKHASEKLSLKYDFDVKSNDESVKKVLDIINNLELELDYGVDYEDESIMLNLGADYENGRLLDIEAYGRGKKMYFDYKDVFPNPYYVELDEKISFDQSLDMYNDLNKIVAGIREAINVSIRDEYVTKEKDNGLDKYTLTIDNSNALDIAIDFLTSLKNNEEFVEAYANLSENEKEDIVKDLEDTIKNIEIDEDLNGDETIKISFYMKGNSLKQCDVQIIDFTDDNINISFKVIDDDNITYNIVYGKNKFSGSIKSVNDYNKVTDTYEIAYYVDDEEIFNAKMVGSLEITYDDVFKDTLSKNALNFEDITEEEYSILSEKIMENETMTKFIEDINSLIPEATDDDFDSEFNDIYDEDLGSDYNDTFDYDVDINYDYE